MNPHNLQTLLHEKKVKMNKQKIHSYQTEISFDTVNESVEFYLIEQGKEEVEIRGLIK